MNSRDTIRPAAVVAWALGSLFFFYAFALRVSPSVMINELMRDYNVGALALGNLSAFYFYVYAAVQIPIGIFIDRIGPRRLMSVAALICAAGCFLFAASDAIAGAYVGRMLIGLGCAFSWVGVLTIIANELPERHFAAFTGGGQFAGTAGAIAGQAPLSMAVESVGWRTSLSGLGIAGVILAVALWFIVRDKPTGGTQTSLLLALKTAASNPQTWILAAIGMSLTGSVLAFAGLWGVPWFNAVYEMDKSQAAPLLSLVFIGWLVGAPLGGWLSDKVQRRRPLLMAGTLLSATTITALLYVPALSTLSLGALLVLNGLGGSMMILTFAAGKEHNPDFARGAALGIINTCVVASGALFQPLIGALLDIQWDGAMADGIRVYSSKAYDIAMLTIPVGALLGFMLTLVLREPTKDS